MSRYDDTLEEVFDQAISFDDPADRDRYVREACGADQELLKQVNSLLDAHHDSDGLLEPARRVADTIAFPDERPGARIGPYKLLQQIGEGGFGVVYMARQDEPINRMVALKVVKPGMDTREVIARFEAERQALALMDHPNIARVLDAGATDKGRPYFVMELVKGVPMTEFWDKNNSSTRERLRLFLDVCSAVQHAHQKGIIHRDLKPSNVMITLHDGRPVAKVIDFGVAKAIGPQLTAKTLFTRYGQMVGTPQYMSPEQAEMSGLDVDTRSDIYTLGVLLYELLTGTTPLKADRLREAGYLEMLRMIQQEEPLKPSTRLSTLGDELTVVCEHRSTDPKRLGQLVRGDLDWIVMKALEKDRGRRYETVSNLAADIQRHLNDEPVSAGPPSSVYRLHKFVRRNRTLVLAASAVLLALLTGLSLAVVGFIRASVERDRARVAETGATYARADAEDQRDAADDARVAEAKLREHTDQTLYFHQVNLAHREWLNNNPVRAEQLLAACKPEYRGWEWRYVKNLFSSRIATLEGHTLDARRVAFSPDGRHLASCSGVWGQSDGGEVIIWDVQSRKELSTFRVDGGLPTSVVFSADGDRVAASVVDFEKGTGGRIIVWQVATGRQIQRIASGGRASNFFCVAFRPNGESVASAGSDGAVRLWSLETGNEVRVLGRHMDNAFGVAFSPDGQLLASAGRDGTVRVWDAHTGSSLHVLQGSPDFRCVRFTHDGRHLVAGGYPGLQGIFKVWDLSRNAEEIAEHRFPGGAVTDFDLSADGQHVVLQSTNGSVHVWETISGREVRVFHAHSGVTTGVAFGPNGRMVASAGSDKMVRLWDMAVQSGAREYVGHSTYIDDMEFSGNGNRLALAGGLHRSRPGAGSKTLNIWDFREDKVSHVLAGHTGWLTSVALSRDGTRAATGSHDKTIRVWDVDSRRVLQTLKGHNDSITSVAFSPDEKLLASASKDKTIKLWNAKSGEQLATLGGHSESVVCVKFHPNGDLLGSASADHTARLWDVKTRTELAALGGHTRGLTKIAFSSDGAFAATAGLDQLVIIWEINAIEDGRWRPSQRYTLRGHAETVSSLVFSPGGKRLATGGSQLGLKVWDVATGQEAISLPNLHGPVLDVVFSPDGKRLMATRGSFLRIWDATIRSPAEREQHHKEGGIRWHRDQADACERSKNWLGARHHLSLLVEEQPKRAEYYARRGYAYAQLGDADDDQVVHDAKMAHSDYETAIRLTCDGRRGLLMTGRGEHVTAPHVPFDEYEAFTIEAWFAGGWKRTLLCQGTGGDPESSLWVAPSPRETGGWETFMCGWESSGKEYHHAIGDRVQPGWNHVALVFDGGVQRLFLSGKLLHKQMAPKPGPLNKNRLLMLGAFESSRGVHSGSGLLKSIRISQAALYDSDFKPPEKLEALDDCVLLYDFESNRDWMQDADILDLSGNGNDGILKNAWWIPRSGP